MSEYPSAGDIQGDDKSGLIDLLYRLADDDLVIGHRNSEWTGLAPILEADIAFSSIAQDQIGQARAYYGLLQDLGESDPDTLAFLRDADTYRCASLGALARGDWAFSTVRLFLYEVYKSLRLAALCESGYVPLAQLSRKLRGEQKYHLMHAKMWITRLGDGTPDSHQRMQSALDELYGHALGLFEQTKWNDCIAASGIGPDESALGDAWRAEIATLLTDCGLSVPCDAEAVLGGRQGKHPPDLNPLLEAMQKVYRLEPTASW